MVATAEKTKKYRERAKQIRVLAEDMRGDDERRFLLSVARDYEKLADSSERQR
jgi:hypothetical protein